MVSLEAELDRWAALKPCEKCPARDLCRRKNCRKSISGWLTLQGLSGRPAGKKWLLDRLPS